MRDRIELIHNYWTEDHKQEYVVQIVRGRTSRQVVQMLEAALNTAPDYEFYCNTTSLMDDLLIGRNCIVTKRFANLFRENLYAPEFIGLAPDLPQFFGPGFMRVFPPYSSLLLPVDPDVCIP